MRLLENDVFEDIQEDFTLQQSYPDGPEEKLVYVNSFLVISCGWRQSWKGNPDS